MTLNRDWILRRVPHAGTMCLLDEVEAWDPNGITCRTARHRDPENPLRGRGRLAGVCAIELAAQTMAVHGALLRGDSTPPSRGYLASVRGVDLLVERLDDLESELEVRAERLLGDGNHVIYGFSVTSRGRLLASGRATVVLDAEARQGRPCTECRGSGEGRP